MLYLIESSDYYKIGYTKNLKIRIQQYKTCNPDFKLLGTIDGDQIDEKILHNKCKKYHYKNEWYYKNRIILKTFKSYVSNDSERELYLNQCKKPKSNEIVQLNFAFKVIRVWPSQAEAERQLSLYQGAISKVLNKSISVGGFKWKTIDKLSEEEKTSLKICGEPTLKTE